MTFDSMTSGHARTVVPLSKKSGDKIRKKKIDVERKRPILGINKRDIEEEQKKNKRKKDVVFKKKKKNTDKQEKEKEDNIFTATNSAELSLSPSRSPQNTQKTTTRFYDARSHSHSSKRYYFYVCVLTILRRDV